MYYLNLDENNYLLSISTTPTDNPAIESIDGYDFTGYRLMACRYEDGSLIFDQDRFTQLNSEHDSIIQKAYLESIKLNDTEMALVELADICNELQNGIVELAALVSELSERGNA